MDELNPIHVFGDAEPQDTDASLKVTYPEPVFGFGLLARDGYAFWTADEDTKRAVVSNDVSYLYGAYELDPKPRVIGKNGDTTVRIDLTKHKKNGDGVPYVNFHRDEHELVFYATQRMITDGPTEIFVDTKTNYKTMTTATRKPQVIWGTKYVRTNLPMGEEQMMREVGILGPEDVRPDYFQFPADEAWAQVRQHLPEYVPPRRLPEPDDTDASAHSDDD